MGTVKTCVATVVAVAGLSLGAHGQGVPGVTPAVGGAIDAEA